jgi:hypothetical protein
MKSLMSLMLGLSLLTGATAMFAAQDKPAETTKTTKSTTKVKKAKKPKKETDTTKKS